MKNYESIAICLKYSQSEFSVNSDMDLDIDIALLLRSCKHIHRSILASIHASSPPARQAAKSRQSIRSFATQCEAQAGYIQAQVG